MRRDIREGHAGITMLLKTTVVDASTCKPIRGAAVDVWHCDAAGVYSGVNGNTGTFLRGIQRTDAKGLATFVTIFPGWYQGRTTHIHVKVHLGGNVVHTGQLYFPEAAVTAAAKTDAVQPEGRAGHPQRGRRDLPQRRQQVAHPGDEGRGGPDGRLDHDGSAPILTRRRGRSSTTATPAVATAVAANANRTPALPSARPARSGVTSAVTAQARFITPITSGAESPSLARAPTA